MSDKKAPLTRLRQNKTGTKFNDLVKILNELGFKQQSVKGSHHVFGKLGCLPVMLVKPHGGKKHCHPMDVSKVIKVLEKNNS